MTMRIPSSLLVLLALSSSVLAQQETSSDTSLSGRKALSFSFSGLNLGGGLGGKYWFDNDYWIRGTLTGKYSNRKSEEVDRYSHPFTYNETATELGIRLGVARTIFPNLPLHPYLGIAADVFHEWYKLERVYKDSTETGTFSQFRYGGTLFIGVEYWVTNKISFSGEQTVTFSYSDFDDTNSTVIGNSTSSLILSVYF